MRPNRETATQAAPRGGGFFTTDFEKPAPVPREAAGSLRKVVIIVAVVEGVAMLAALLFKLGLWPF